METAEKIASAIQNSNLSYRELERLTGLSKTTIKRYANCEIKKVSIEATIKIAKATNNDARELLGWSNENSISITEKQEKLIELVKTLDDSQCDIISNLINQFLSTKNQQTG